MDLFKIDPGLAIWTWVAFGILFTIMARLILPMVDRNMKNRQTLIHNSVDKALEIERLHGELASEREAVLRQARSEADAMLRKAREEAEVLGKELSLQAEEEARHIVERARSQAERERQAMLESLRDDLAAFVCDSAEQVIGTSFTGERDRTWARELAGTL